MDLLLEPIQVNSLKEACIQKLERLILSGDLKVGTHLPPERQLAAMLDVSRPVLHQAIVELEARGLVRIVPRRGVIVNDFRTNGSLALLTSLLSYHEGDLDPTLKQSMIDVRLLIERETARLAALHRTDEQLQQLNQIVEQEQTTDRRHVRGLVELDFAFHLHVALASGNAMYPLIMNSFKGVYTNLTSQFFTRYRQDATTIDEVYGYHCRLVTAIANRDEEAAAAVMVEMLDHGAQKLLAPP
jgi:DNA-binding FadR family transcriptional regulator